MKGPHLLIDHGPIEPEAINDAEALPAEVISMFEILGEAADPDDEVWALHQYL